MCMSYHKEMQLQHNLDHVSFLQGVLGLKGVLRDLEISMAAPIIGQPHALHGWLRERSEMLPWSCEDHPPQLIST
jgi:hypothetical protein